jgi:hypothetical protein
MDLIYFIWPRYHVIQEQGVHRLKCEAFICNVTECEVTRFLYVQVNVKISKMNENLIHFLD